MQGGEGQWMDRVEDERMKKKVRKWREGRITLELKEREEKEEGLGGGRGGILGVEEGEEDGTGGVKEEG